MHVLTGIQCVSAPRIAMNIGSAGKVNLVLTPNCSKVHPPVVCFRLVVFLCWVTWWTDVVMWSHLLTEGQEPEIIKTVFTFCRSTWQRDNPWVGVAISSGMWRRLTKLFPSNNSWSAINQARRCTVDWELYGRSDADETQFSATIELCVEFTEAQNFFSETVPN